MPPLAKALLLPLLLGAAAPQQSAPNGQEIVVTAQNPATVREFVTAVSDPGPTGQLGRWSQFCPGVSGVGDAQAALIVERLKAASRSVRVDTGGAHCRPTTLILFSNEAPQLAAEFAHRLPVTLRTDGQPRLHRFAVSRLPVRWVTVTDPCGGEHCAVPFSLFTKGTRPTFLVMIVIVDGTKIHGYGLDEVTDYLAAVALGNPPMASSQPRESILSMFEVPHPADRRFALTDADRAYLTGLYLTPTDAGASAQRSAIASHMRRDQKNQR
jgi:hypothetical protein